MSDHHPIAVLPKGEQWSILLHGLLTFIVTGGLALAGGARAIVRGGYVPSDFVTIPYALMSVGFATALVLLAVRIVKHPRAFEAVFALTMLSGAWLLADLFFPSGLALLVGSLVILARFAWKTVFVANLCLAIGVAGVAASLATLLSPTALLALLIVLALYDLVAVYGTKHMVTMFRALASRGAVFAFLLTPLVPRALFAKPAADARGMFLGTGDVALPVMLAVAALRLGPLQAVAALSGAALGFALLFMLFLAQPRRAPLPALPPIALGAAFFYLASFLITLSS